MAADAGDHDRHGSVGEPTNGAGMRQIQCFVEMRTEARSRAIQLEGMSFETEFEENSNI